MKQKRVSLKFNLLELLFIGALVIIVGFASYEAFEGNHVGTDDAVRIAKLKGQQQQVVSSTAIVVEQK